MDNEMDQILLVSPDQRRFKPLNEALQTAKHTTPDIGYTNILTATSASAALELLKDNKDIGVVVAAALTVSEAAFLFSKIKEQSPQTQIMMAIPESGEDTKSLGPFRPDFFSYKDLHKEPAAVVYRIETALLIANIGGKSSVLFIFDPCSAFVFYTRHRDDSRTLCEKIGMKHEIDPILDNVSLHAAGSTQDRLISSAQACSDKSLRAAVVDLWSPDDVFTVVTAIRDIDPRLPIAVVFPENPDKSVKEGFSILKEYAAQYGLTIVRNGDHLFANLNDFLNGRPVKEDAETTTPNKLKTDTEDVLSIPLHLAQKKKLNPNDFQKEIANRKPVYLLLRDLIPEKLRNRVWKT